MQMNTKKRLRNEKHIEASLYQWFIDSDIDFLRVSVHHTNSSNEESQCVWKSGTGKCLKISGKIWMDGE